ncbi:Gfo/Idh/MocA family oxidoreductase [Maribacter sp. MMG018]|uniref:Gfo/Idh/MocA family oxidoreductase n=1 Tax=Maribacter sp. MMG018 TaxID=2822688 RepID=UPI001B358FFE|nr:Gfo/Idh/MocA family oxidoreductase [Maribacter sp. MMG018]MBQ4915828.1 Gfo/Idh/MocA family oxidoreductase [Maribacter sp. MMG018]
MIKLGIIGMSEGNAHPHSWSAIINGCYNAEEINKMGYPAVSNYLKANEDTLGISGAKVTCVWTQDKYISESIAKTAKIETIASSLEEMASMVDAVILARDDPRNHVAMAKPFIDADIPIFIDKPLAITVEDLEYFSNQNAKGKFIMSCSSMRYANECRIVKQELASLGNLELVTAVGKKDWIKYGVHLMEALFSLLDDPKPVSVKHVGEAGKDIVYIKFENGLVTTLHLFMDIAPTFQISLFGQKGWRLMDIKNSYSMFRDNIIEFVRSVEESKPRLPFEKTEMIIKTLIGATESLEKGGKTVYL